MADWTFSTFLDCALSLSAGGASLAGDASICGFCTFICRSSSSAASCLISSLFLLPVFIRGCISSTFFTATLTFSSVFFTTDLSSFSFSLFIMSLLSRFRLFSSDLSFEAFCSVTWTEIVLVFFFSSLTRACLAFSLFVFSFPTVAVSRSSSSLSSVSFPWSSSSSFCTFLAVISLGLLSFSTSFTFSTSTLTVLGVNLTFSSVAFSVGETSSTEITVSLLLLSLVFPIAKSRSSSFSVFSTEI